MKIHITGAEFEYSGNTYKIHYKNEVVDETKDRWMAISICLSSKKLDALLEKKLNGVYNNSLP